jgi:uncharacterized protein GlcG (DUF336 family)
LWRRTVSAASARQIIDAALATVEAMGVPVTVAVVDDSEVLKPIHQWMDEGTLP